MERGLEKALIEGNLRKLKSALPWSKENRIRIITGSMLLHKAAELGHFEIAGYLLQQLNELDHDKKHNILQEALLRAVLNKKIDVAEFLVRNGGRLSDENIYRILQNSSIEALLFLKKYGADFDKAYGYRDVDCTEYPLEIVIWQEDALSKMKILLEGGANPDSYSGCNSMLMVSVQESSFERIKLLCEYGADIDSTCVPLLCPSSEFNNYPRYTPLMISCASGNEKIANFLIEKGADVNKTDRDGNTALRFAIANHLKISEKLISQGAKLDTPNIVGFTPLHTAVYNMNIEAVKLCVNSVCTINLRTNDGETALDLAIKKGHEPIMKLLRKSGGKTSSELINEILNEKP